MDYSYNALATYPQGAIAKAIEIDGLTACYIDSNDQPACWGDGAEDFKLHTIGRKYIGLTLGINSICAWTKEGDVDCNFGAVPGLTSKVSNFVMNGFCFTKFGAEGVTCREGFGEPMEVHINAKVKKFGTRYDDEVWIIDEDNRFTLYKEGKPVKIADGIVDFAHDFGNCFVKLDGHLDCKPDFKDFPASLYKHIPAGRFSSLKIDGPHACGIRGPVSGND